MHSAGDIMSSCECKRSLSTMRRLRTWLHSSMRMERLGSLVVMNIHRDIEVDYKEVATLCLPYRLFLVADRHPNWCAGSQFVNNQCIAFSCVDWKDLWRQSPGPSTVNSMVQ